MSVPKISVITPTLRRPGEIVGLLENLCQQQLPPFEVVLVDGAPPEEDTTEVVVQEMTATLPFVCYYIRHGGGTAIQRNVGLERAVGDFIAFIDDDVRIKSSFFQVIMDVFNVDHKKNLGGVVGYRENSHFRLEDMPRWRWYKRLNLLTVYEPGRYDFETGYPINANMQPPFSGTREVDFMTTACAVWRREVFDGGLRLDPFFRDYGVLEDAHLSLRAGKQWKLLQCGDAHCVELASPNSRENRYKIGYKCVVNYYYVFKDLVKPLTWKHNWRFWRYQFVEFIRLLTSALRRGRVSDVQEVIGRVGGVWAVLRGTAYKGELED